MKSLTKVFVVNFLKLQELLKIHNQMDRQIPRQKLNRQQEIVTQLHPNNQLHQLFLTILQFLRLVLHFQQIVTQTTSVKLVKLSTLIFARHV